MAVLDERTCKRGVQLRKMITASEMFLIKRFLNNFRVRTWNGSEPFVDRSSEYGDWTIWIPEGGGGGGGISLSKVSFGYSLLPFSADLESEPPVPAGTICRINVGSVRFHGIRTYRLESLGIEDEPYIGAEVDLVGETCYVSLGMDRQSVDDTITVSAATQEEESSSTTMRIPLYRFKAKGGGRYEIDWHYRFGGDIDISAPIR